jgi:protocatechuate 3,4-dioxygenase beta subunit
MHSKFISCWAFAISLLLLFNCKGQSRQENIPTSNTIKSSEIVGGPFENREFTFVDMPKHIQSVDTSTGWNQIGQKLLITGTIFQRDGLTPAPNVILYYYHTDINGLYSDATNLDKRVRRHGYIRGWVKSDKNGQYAIYTVRPASYPDSKEPAHIHPSIVEPGIENPYYIDEFVFDDDILLSGQKRKNAENRGGSGVLRVLEKGDLQIAEHNIILGLNIPDYPKENTVKIISGKEVGEDVLSFTPFHAFGPDKGSKTCPVCKYGRYHGILYFVGNNPDWKEISSWLTYLEVESQQRQSYLKAYFVYGNSINYNKDQRQEQLEALGKQLDVKRVALTLVPSFDDKNSDIDLNRINSEVGNTFIIYKQSTIVRKFIDLKANSSNFKMISEALDATRGEFFELKPPKHD